MSLQYLETLKIMGTSPSTKFIFPMEFSSFLAGLLGDSKKAFGKE